MHFFQNFYIKILSLFQSPFDSSSRGSWACSGSLASTSYVCKYSSLYHSVFFGWPYISCLLLKLRTMCDFPDQKLEEEFENGWSESISESSLKESRIDLLNSFVQPENEKGVNLMRIVGHQHYLR